VGAGGGPGCCLLSQQGAIGGHTCLQLCITEPPTQHNTSQTCVCFVSHHFLCYVCVCVCVCVCLQAREPEEEEEEVVVEQVKRPTSPLGLFGLGARPVSVAVCGLVGPFSPSCHLHTLSAVGQDTPTRLAVGCWLSSLLSTLVSLACFPCVAYPALLV
jgi:hypothetical protein